MVVGPIVRLVSVGSVVRFAVLGYNSLVVSLDAVLRSFVIKFRRYPWWCP